MPTGPALVTGEEVAAFLQEDLADLPDSLGTIIELASDAVRDELGQRVDLVTGDVEEVIGGGTDVLLLPELPVVSVAGVTVPADVGGDDEELTAAAGDYRLERGRLGRFGVLRRLGGLVWPRRPIMVTYDHGYALGDAGPPVVPTEVPGAIRLVVIRATARALFNPVGVRQESVGRYSATYAGDAATVSVELSATDRTTLGPFYPGSKAGRR
jgi:hypothetical protein